MLETSNSVLPCRFVEYLYLELIGSTFCYFKNGRLGLKRKERVELFWADHMVFKGKRGCNRCYKQSAKRGLWKIECQLGDH